MKTETRLMAMYRDIQHGYTMIRDVEKFGENKDAVLISNIVDVEFEVVGEEGEKDAFKALQIKEAQERIKVAQAELKALL